MSLVRPSPRLRPTHPDLSCLALSCLCLCLCLHLPSSSKPLLHCKESALCTVSLLFCVEYLDVDSINLLTNTRTREVENPCSDYSDDSSALGKQLTACFTYVTFHPTESQPTDPSPPTPDPDSDRAHMRMRMRTRTRTRSRKKCRGSSACDG